MLYDGQNPILWVTDVAQRYHDAGKFSIGPRKYAEFLFLTTGSIFVRCGTEDYCLKPGDILYLPQNMAYSISYSDAKIISVCFETLYLDQLPELYSFPEMQSFFRLFTSMLYTWNSKDDGGTNYKINSVSMLYRILCTIQSRNQVPPRLSKAVAFIRANYRNSDLTVGQVCEYAEISASRLRQLFNTHYKKSPIEYIITLRLLYARILIADGVPIETAALESGFNDPKYFAKVTKKYLNRTPSELKDFE